MKLIELAISNYKRIKAVELRPGDGTFIVGGRNAQGKTSVLDALENLFNGARVACERPIRTGAEAASIKGTLDSGLTVKRTFDSDGRTVLEVRDGRGKVSSPQKFLDELTGRGIAFDPLAFQRMEPVKQLETLRRLMGVDMSTLDAQRKTLYDSRAEAGRDVSTRKAQIDSMPEYPDVPEKEQGAPVLANQLRLANEHNAVLTNLQAAAMAAERDRHAAVESVNAAVASVRQWDAAMTDAVTALTVTIKQSQTASRTSAQMQIVDTAEIEAKIAALQVQLREAHEHNEQVRVARADAEHLANATELAQGKVDGANKEVEAWKGVLAKRQAVATEKEAAAQKAKERVAAFQPTDTASIVAAIENSQQTARKCEANRAKAALRRQFAELKAQYDDLTVQIDAIDRKKGEILASLTFPVPGLSFGLHGVLYNGLPLDQASSAEQLRVSTGIALALCPKRDDAIKILLIRDGSLLDPDSLREIVQMATAADAQVLIERVTDDSKQANVIIEDGMVRLPGPRTADEGSTQ